MADESRKLGYARVSTSQQSLDIQVKALIQKGVKKRDIYTDKASGKDTDRDGLKELLKVAQPGDEIYVTKMDRLGRSTLDMLQLVEHFSRNGITVRFFQDNLSTSGSFGKMLVQIISAIAEQERARILERTNEGRLAAYEKGIKFGRKPLITPAQALEASKKYDTLEQAAKALKVSRTTFYRRLKQAKEN